MNVFEQAIDDIFQVRQFREVMTVNHREITVVSYDSSTDTSYTEFGVDGGKVIRITCKVKDYSPVKGEKVKFRNTPYKVDSWTTDSHNLCHIITLKSLESV